MDKGGRYQARQVVGYKDNGQPQFLTKLFDTSEEAEAWLAEVRPTLLNSRSSVIKKTIPELIQDFLEFKKISLDAKTLDSYKFLLESYVIPYFERTRLKDLNDETCKRWLIKLSSKTTPKQTHKAVRHFSIVLNDAERAAPMFRNPLRYLDVQKPRRKRLPRWTADEVLSVLEHCEKTNHVLHPYVHVALTTGMRRQELLGLRWQDINEAELCLSVVQVCTYTSGSYTLKERPKTEDSERIIFIDRETFEMLGQQKRRISRMKKRQWQEHDLVFPSISGTPLSERWLRDTFYELCREAKVTKIQPTSLRATYVALSDGKVPDKVAAERTGHSEKMRRDVYLRTVRQEHKDAALSISELTAKPKKRG